MTDTNAVAYYYQAQRLLQQNRFDEAVTALNAAIDIRPRYPVAYFLLGKALLASQGATEAIPSFEKAVEQLPSYFKARYELANAYRDTYRYSDAEREMGAVIQQKPDFALAYSALGIIYLECGKLNEATKAFSSAMHIDPYSTNAASNWLNTQQYIPGVNEQNLAESHAVWAELYSTSETSPSFENPRTRDRPLRVGFVSPDLAEHPVGRLSVGLFENLDHAEIEPFVFSTRPQTYEDELSERIADVTTWRRVFGQSDDALATLIKRSRIDVLFDMSGHTANNRLRLFTRRLAPIQVSWLGYPGSTGLSSVDYVLANNELVPPSVESFYSENVIRMPRWHASLEPPQDAPATGPLPARENGFITFGCFNNPTKLNGEVIESFAQILARVPSSRLKLQYKSLRDAEIKARLRAGFAAQNIAEERLDLSGYLPTKEFLSSYNDIDVALDTFPYSGCMTTCDATWMGCPVVTVRGASFAGRQAASYLKAAGLENYVARDRSDYVDVAVNLANNLDKLTVMRDGLRAQLAASSVCDSASYAQDFTAKMREIWSVWCVEANHC